MKIAEEFRWIKINNFYPTAIDKQVGIWYLYGMTIRT